jgi:predicted DsbA family dithiol-disulfide isomerase
VTAFDACLSSDRHQARIDKDGEEVRVTGTPTFIIGKSAGDTVSGQLVIGAQAPAVFTAEIQRVLEQAAADKPPSAKKPAGWFMRIKPPGEDMMIRE